ncbi:DUF488 domain-containing protein [Corynebacterium sputi]|uniref:DUF488 domain-containing protein n=1 Tax=Corynebacterium sputi TaxID=489915 RepID=UPI0004150600|nr:DUF488 family protein [Corynebacterium sputi]
MTSERIRTAKIHDLRRNDGPYVGTETLVDRLWPRGVAKDSVKLAHWFQDVAPSPELRKWWDHDPDRFDEFSSRYCAELDEMEGEELEQLQEMATGDEPLVLVFAAKDRTINHATVLANWLLEHTD